MTKPRILNKTADQKRRGFLGIHSREQIRIEEGMTNPSSAFSVNTALEPHNSTRNRYTNVNPFEYNRVTLKTVSSDANNYINASRITLSDTHNYIAAQGPLKQTVAHFWSMCWNELEAQNNDTIIIAMITPLVENNIIKCHKYWPLDEQPIDMSQAVKQDSLLISGGGDDFTILLESSNHCDTGDFEHSVFLLHSGLKTKKVHHLYYYQWADCKVPPSLDHLYSLSRVIDTLKNESDAGDPPIPVVHCSAGVGRTGTFIALDYLLTPPDSAAFGNEDTIESVVEELRCQRMMMVQTVYQFNYLYDVLDGSGSSPSIFKWLTRKLKEVKA